MTGLQRNRATASGSNAHVYVSRPAVSWTTYAEAAKASAGAERDPRGAGDHRDRALMTAAREEAPVTLRGIDPGELEPRVTRSHTRDHQSELRGRPATPPATARWPGVSSARTWPRSSRRRRRLGVGVTPQGTLVANGPRCRVRARLPRRRDLQPGSVRIDDTYAFVTVPTRQAAAR